LLLDAWFDSSDPWYATEGFEFSKCFTAMNRLFAQGDIEPKAAVTPDQRNLARELAIAMFLKPTLRLVVQAPLEDHIGGAGGPRITRCIIMGCHELYPHAEI
jgi:hypothetical protein